jgi:hypothetical protein
VGRETNRRRRERQAVSAREKAATARAAQQRTDQRRRAMTVLATVVTIAVVLAVVAVIAITQTRKNTTAGDRATLNPSVMSDVTNVSPATLQTVGKGTSTLLPKPISDAPLTSHGKPQVLFIGAEFCPYCAAQRWPLIQALSRFGTFHGLQQISSSSSDVDPNTPTFTFYKANYTSKYVAFRPVEAEDRAQKKLESPTKAEAGIWVKYSGNPPGFPFLDFGGKFVQTSQSFDPGILAGKTQSQIASQLNEPTTPISQAIVGGANALTAAICTTTNNQPSSVCLSPAITNLQSEIGA